ncbi:MAG: hypothetical protein WAN22_31240, partial [Solirubrobacteraceae bacterium]
MKDDHVPQARAATERDGEPHNPLVIAHHRTHQRVVRHPLADELVRPELRHPLLERRQQPTLTRRADPTPFCTPSPPSRSTETVGIDRFEPDGDATVVGSWGKYREAFPVGSRLKLEGESVTALVYRTQRPVRVGSYE